MCVFPPSAHTQRIPRERVMSDAQLGGWQGPFRYLPFPGAQQLTNLCVYPGLCPTLLLPPLFLLSQRRCRPGRLPHFVSGL